MKHCFLICAASIWLVSPAAAEIEKISSIDELPNASRRIKQLGYAQSENVRSTTAPRDTQGRTIPEMVKLSDLSSHFLEEKAVALPSANTLAHLHFRKGRLGQLRRPSGEIHLFNPQIVLVKFRGATHVAALRVEENCELIALRTLAARNDVEFAELDIFQQRQFTPSDPQISMQWHHTSIGSFAAWEKSRGQASIRIAIVDTPFQMNHPDLANNTVSGWDVTEDQPITASDGIAHSTVTAGMAAAAINNQIGVAGVANCSILPININGAISEMYNAIVWAADNGVRVVNISWTGADSSVLNDGGLYLKTKSRGLLVMAGVNGSGFLNYPNHPHIYCISMTDAADNMRSRHGEHIDLAAPGWQVYSTTTNSGYTSDSGTSYSTPLFAGVAAIVLSINPFLNADEVFEIIKSTAADKGSPGWDQYFGWGRINFAAAASAAQATLPTISSIEAGPEHTSVVTQNRTNITYSLWKSSALLPGSWINVSNVLLSTNGSSVTLRDPAPPGSKSFYRLQLSAP